MNLGQMRDRVRQVLHDDAKAFVSDFNITDWLNDAQLDLAGRLKELDATKTGTCSGNVAAFALPTDFLEVRQLLIPYTTGENEVAWTDDQVFENWTELTGSPHAQIGRVYAGNIEVYPTVASGTAYTLRYTRSPATLVKETDTPEVAAALHPRLVDYARAQGKYMLGESSDGDRCFSMYERGLPGSYLGREWSRPGPLNVRVDPGPFDLDESAHI